jgi:hypothetical protein
LKDEIDRMKDLGVISKVITPTYWVHSFAEKTSGGIRVSLDPRYLNKTVLRPHYPMRSIDDALPMLTNTKYFTKLDARSGYWGLKLKEESSYLTTFNSPLGRYRFKRLPFGLKSS